MCLWPYYSAFVDRLYSYLTSNILLWLSGFKYSLCWIMMYGFFIPIYNGNKHKSFSVTILSENIPLTCLSP